MSKGFGVFNSQHRGVQNSQVAYLTVGTGFYFVDDKTAVDGLVEEDGVKIVNSSGDHEVNIPLNHSTNLPCGENRNGE